MRDFHIDVTSLQNLPTCSLSIAVKGQPVTEHFNEQDVLQTHIIVDPLPLAEWMAANWWRLRWEPEKENLTTEQQLDWDMSHRLASSGTGYVWPDLTFISDDFAINCLASTTSGKFSKIRYIRQLNEWIDANFFEAGMDEFLNATAMANPSSNLAVLWQEVIDERKDIYATKWRKLEAKAGYDAGEASDALIEGLQSYYPIFGEASVEELSSENRSETVLPIAEELYSSLQDTGEEMKPDLAGFQEQFPGLLINGSSPPWMQAANAAHWVRRKLGLKVSEPVTNERLLEYLDVGKQVFNQHRKTPLASAGLKKDQARAMVLLSPGRETAQRFALSRLLGDYLYTYQKDDSQLLSTTHSRTNRQKFQRAFAQELLCPYEGLLETMDTAQPSEESLEKSAELYKVSPLTVRYTIENKQS